MNISLVRLLMIVVMAAWAVSASGQSLSPRNADEELVIGRGRDEFERLPPEVRNNIRIPGLADDEPSRKHEENHTPARAGA